MNRDKNGLFLWFATNIMVRPFLATVYRLRVEGLEHLNTPGPLLLVMKHRSWIDTIIPSVLIKRPITYMAKSELFDNLLGDFPDTPLFHIGRLFSPAISRMLYMLGIWPVDRENPARSLSTFKKVMKSFDNDETAIIYPEGHVVRNEMGEFREGFLNMMVSYQERLGKRIGFLPVGIRYEEGRFFRKRVDIRISKAMYFNRGEKPGEILRRKIAELSDIPMK